MKHTCSDMKLWMKTEQRENNGAVPSYARKSIKDTRTESSGRSLSHGVAYQGCIPYSMTQSMFDLVY
jgi:hypothetical protein